MPVSCQAHNIDMRRPRRWLVLEARCPKCGKKAQVDDDMANVKCGFCGYSATYDEYIDLMKEKAVLMSDDYQMNWDRNPF